MISESDLSNILVHQKDEIFSLILKGNYDQAISRLETLQELWLACSYEYKFKELAKRIYIELWSNFDLPGQHYKTRQKIDEQMKALKEKFPKYI